MQWKVKRLIDKREEIIAHTLVCGLKAVKWQANYVIGQVVGLYSKIATQTHEQCFCVFQSSNPPNGAFSLTSVIFRCDQAQYITVNAPIWFFSYQA